MASLPHEPQLAAKFSDTSTPRPVDPAPHNLTSNQYSRPQTSRTAAFALRSDQSTSPPSSNNSQTWSERDASVPTTPTTDPHPDEAVLETPSKLPPVPEKSPQSARPTTPSSGHRRRASTTFLSEVGSPKKNRRASTTLISSSGAELSRLLGKGQSGTQLIEKFCCGGGCCKISAVDPAADKHLFDGDLVEDLASPEVPDNEAFRSLKLKLGRLASRVELTDITPLPPCNVSFEKLASSQHDHVSTVDAHPPTFVQPHPPYNVYSAPLHHARELTNPGAVKRTFHFDIDVTEYPDEGGVDFKVGGAIGVCPPNDPRMVEDVLQRLCIPNFVRDKPVKLKTQGGRWPTIWGDERPRELITTRRELLTWCTDIQSTPPTKQLLRVLAEYASDPKEKRILTFLCSSQGQPAFCDLRTTTHITVPQLLHAFPSSHPPLPQLLAILPQLMPRFYSLSNDPHISSERPGLTGGRRLIEMAVTIHETNDWRSPTRTGVGSGFLERIAHRYAAAEKAGAPLTGAAALHVPIFRGLMANPLSQRFATDGPMMLIGAGVGMAPFRGFILNRLKRATCANKIWLVQGVRDSSLDELYHGELGLHESEIKRVVQSRAKRPVSPPLAIAEDVDPATVPVGALTANEPVGAVPAHAATKHSEARYVQDEVRLQADVVWFVVNALDGRVFVCGSSQGMGEGVEEALVDVVMAKGGLNESQAKDFWEAKREGGQYITETW